MNLTTLCEVPNEPQFFPENDVIGEESGFQHSENTSINNRNNSEVTTHTVPRWEGATAVLVQTNMGPSHAQSKLGEKRGSEEKEGGKAFWNSPAGRL